MATEDRLDEAEGVIVAMAEELSRVKRAAEQLSEAHDDVDRLVKSAESLSEQAASLSSRGVEVFEALGELDLPGHFAQTAERLGEVKQEVADVAESLTPAVKAALEPLLTRIAAIERKQRWELSALLIATILLGLIGAANFIAQLVYR